MGKKLFFSVLSFLIAITLMSILMIDDLIYSIPLSSTFRDIIGIIASILFTILIYKAITMKYKK